MTAAVFVVSTGRCGTQWLARFLSQNLGNAAAVTHEPLDNAWSPREMLAAGTPQTLDEDLRVPIDEHLQFIRGVLQERVYIECGHPLWSSLPFLIDTFGPDVRVIHLVRHPVPTAWSWLTQRAYCPPLEPYLREKVLLSPFDRGVRFPEYRRRWESMTPFEKALYYWLEVNAFARDCRSRTPAWLTLRFEDMFERGARHRILEFVTGRDHAGPLKEPGFVDDLHFLTEAAVDPALIAEHPSVLQLAAELGFDALRFDANRLRSRYSAV